MGIDIDAYEEEFEQQHTRSKKIKAKPSKDTPLESGRITKSTPELFYVAYQDQIIGCSLKGTFKKELKQNKDRLSCGDLIYFDPEKKVIEKRQDRSTLLIRENPSHQHHKQILAVNVDQLLITTSVVEPKINPYLIDLYVISAERSGLIPVIIVNKVDLLSAKKLPASAQQEKKLVQVLQKQYEALGIAFVCVSAKDLKGFKELQHLMKDKASVFSGESGVGKSSLINAIEKTSLKVGDMGSTNKGTHTTTSSELLPLKCGGWCVDTPGIQSLSFNELSPIEVRNSFKELKDCGCKFSDCLHQNEAGCEIKSAIEKKQVFELRLESYYRLLEEIKTFKKPNS